MLMRMKKHILIKRLFQSTQPNMPVVAEMINDYDNRAAQKMNLLRLAQTKMTTNFL